MLTFRNAWQHDLLRTGGQREGVRCSRGHWNDLLQVVACQDVHDVCDIQCPVSRVILYGSMTSIEDIGFMYSCMNLPTYHHGGEKKPSQESTKKPAAKVWENEFLNFMWDICYVVILNLIIYNICSSCELRLLAQNASNKNQYLKKKHHSFLHHLLKARNGQWRFPPGIRSKFSTSRDASAIVESRS